ncbi:MAG: MFS transporter [Bryobacterales bacterium]|nr:MFS transporter [Bryobacterales bacterium]
MSPGQSGGAAGLREDSLVRKSLAGFLLSGILVAFLGAILPAWGFHVSSQFLVAGSYFLSLNAGMLASIKPAQVLLSRKGVRFLLVLSSGSACAGFLYLAAVPMAASPWWRVGGLFLLGLSLGWLTNAAFHAISPLYARDRAATLNLAGAFFGLGCLLVVILVAGAFYVYTVPSILVLLALIPGFFAGSFAKSRFSAAPPPPQPTLREAFNDFKSPGALVFSVLLFIQFGNEWALAGWLPLLLVQRLGASPAVALKILSVYWLALLIGRVALQPVLPRVRHGRLLFLSTLSALFGCAILYFTRNLFGAASGVLFVGAGFAPIYPVVAEMIGDRFPYYHPGFFNGIFSWGSTGGWLAPATMGLYAHLWGIRVVIFLPMLGSCAVFLLAVLLLAYARLTRRPRPA